jgi:predicted PurR-regulated permease PerM
MELSSLRDAGFARPFALACVTVTLVALAAAALVSLSKLILLLVLAFVLEELLSAAADLAHRKLGGPRGLYVGLTLLLVLGTFAGLIALFVFPVADQARKLGDALPGYMERLERMAERASPHAAAEGAPRVQETVTGKLPAALETGVSVLLGGFEQAFDLLGAAFFAFFVALSPAAHREGFLRLFPAAPRPRLEAFLDEASRSLRGWLGVVAISMSIVGVLVSSGLWFAGVDYWLVFGLFSAGMELVPYAGPFLGFLGPFATCLLEGERGRAAFVLVLFLAVRILMSNVVIPYVLKRRIDIPASLAIASILLLGIAAGVLGLVAAVPLVALVLAAIRTLPARATPVAAPA